MRSYLEAVGYIFLLSLIFYPFELLLPAEKGQRFVKRLLNLAYVPLYLLLAFFVVGPIANAVSSQILTLSGGGLIPRLGPLNSVGAQVLLAVFFAIAWDVCQYWLHRWQHSSGWLWQIHKFHHSETALNASTRGRQHIFHLALATVFYFPVLIVFGTQSIPFLASFLMFRMWGSVNHANLRISFGPLTPLVSGPQWHRIHHSTVEAHRDRNFATFFPFIDKIFGTYYQPAKDEFPPTGLIDGEKSNPLAEATFQPLVYWARQSTKTIKKLRATAR